MTLSLCVTVCTVSKLLHLRREYEPDSSPPPISVGAFSRNAFREARSPSWVPRSNQASYKELLLGSWDRSAAFPNGHQTPLSARRTVAAQNATLATWPRSLRRANHFANVSDSLGRFLQASFEKTSLWHHLGPKAAAVHGDPSLTYCP